MPLDLRTTFSRDLLSSFVVFLVALPLCLGIAIASGAPPAAGLIAGVIGGLLVGSLAGSPLQVSGPAAGLAVLVFEIIQTHGMAGLGVAVFIGGLLQMTAGWLRLGQWFRAISPAVIYGMLAGIGVLILTAQFHVMVDDVPRDSGLRNIIEIPGAIVLGLSGGAGHRSAAFVGLLTLGALLAWNGFAPARLRWIPGALIGVLAGTVVSTVWSFDIRYVQLPETLIGGNQLLSPASFMSLFSIEILVAAATIAFVASAETLLSAGAVDRMQDGPRTNYDRELVAQGVGNTLSGILGALPITGVIVRSATNVTAGARTRLSAVMHGGWLLLFLLAFPHLLQLIPTASLAAVLVYTGYRLVDLNSVRRLAAYGRMPVAIYTVTAVLIVATDMLTGILAGLALSAAQILYRLSHFDVRLQQVDDAVHVHLTGAGTFMRLPTLLASLESLPVTTAVHVHVHHVAYVDDAVLECLAGWEKQRRLQGGGPVAVEWERVIDIYGQRHRADAVRIRQLLASGTGSAH